MNSLVSFIQELSFSRENVILLMILLSTIFVVSAVFLVAVGGRTPMKKRLDSIAIPSEGEEKKSKLKNKLDSLSPMLTPQNSKERDDIRSKLIRAGFHDESAISYFYVIKIVTTFIGLTLAGFYYVFSGTDAGLIVFVAFGAGIGMFIPNMLLNHLMKKRQTRIKRGVPDALDLLVVCTESGLGLNMALVRVARELALSHPDLAEELETVCLKIKAGYEMPHAFRDMVERTGVTELSGLVGMLSHASRIGGSLAQTLRDYTEDYRDKRNQEVEEIAAKIPTKMVFPMILCIWPCFFIVVLGPAVLAAIDGFSQINGR